MAAIVSVRKIGNTVERMDGCKSSIEIIILTSKKKKCMTATFIEIRTPLPE